MFLHNKVVFSIYCWVIFYWEITHIVYPFTYSCLFEFFPVSNFFLLWIKPLGTYTSNFWWNHDSIYLYWISKNGVVGPKSRCKFNTLRNSQTVHNDYTIPHSYSKSITGPVSSNSNHHLLFSDTLILTILGLHYLVMSLTYIFLIIKFKESFMYPQANRIPFLIKCSNLFTHF